MLNYQRVRENRQESLDQLIVLTTGPVDFTKICLEDTQLRNGIATKFEPRIE